ncbi:RES family NAD+ phosphorylase [Chromobacterium piscinae]|uniref:RES family NAD+ phosphorylase n=1 Tax=Chromobacterium amazonense TaxID=1382803 RepID=UPI000582EABE|nr:hypothetical protein QR66_17740 [Chromobacterium piscinae]
MASQTFFRVARGPYRRDLSGRGAELFGGRWNPVGTPAFYAASSISLAMLEMLVHAQHNPLDHFVMKVLVPDRQIAAILPADLPSGWNQLSDQTASQQLAMGRLFAADTFGLLVPSVVVPEEWNLVLNPRHRLMSEVSIAELRPLDADPRLL